MERNEKNMAVVTNSVVVKLKKNMPSKMMMMLKTGLRRKRSSGGGGGGGIGIKMAHNRWILYSVFFVSIVQICYLGIVGNLEMVWMFMLVTFLGNFFTNNMVVVLSTSIVVVSILTHFRHLTASRNEGFEGGEKEGEKDTSSSSPSPPPPPPSIQPPNAAAAAATKTSSSSSGGGGGGGGADNDTDDTDLLLSKITNIEKSLKDIMINQVLPQTSTLTDAINRLELKVSDG